MEINIQRSLQKFYTTAWLLSESLWIYHDEVIGNLIVLISIEPRFYMIQTGKILTIWAEGEFCDWIEEIACLTMSKTFFFHARHVEEDTWLQCNSVLLKFTMSISWQHRQLDHYLELVPPGIVYFYQICFIIRMKRYLCILKYNMYKELLTIKSSILLFCFPQFFLLFCILFYFFPGWRDCLCHFFSLSLPDNTAG